MKTKKLLSALLALLLYVQVLPAFAAPVDNGGTNLTSGKVPYATDADSIADSGIYWDNANSRVGLGTTSPIFKLHVIGGNGNEAGLDNDGSRFTQLDFLNSGVQKSLVTWDNTAGVFRFQAVAASSQISLWTANSERVRIDATGNVGIGTTSPGQKLTVAGTIESTTGGVKFPDGTTQTSAANISGSLTSGRVPYASASNTLADSANLKFSGSGLQVGSAPTGGDPGAGYINVSGGYKVNNVAVPTWTGSTAQLAYGNGTNTLGGSAAFVVDATLVYLALTKSVLNAYPLESLSVTVSGNRDGAGSVSIPQVYGPNITEVSYAAGIVVDVTDTSQGHGVGTVTTASIQASSTTIPVASTVGFAASGTAYLSPNDAFTYTSVDATNFLGVSGIGATYGSGSAVIAVANNNGVSSHAAIFRHNLNAGFTGYGIGASVYMTASRNSLAGGADANDTYGFLAMIRSNNSVANNVVGYYSQVTVDDSNGGLKANFVGVLSNHTNTQSDRHGIVLGVGDVTDGPAGTTNYTAGTAVLINAKAGYPTNTEAWQYAFRVWDGSANRMTIANDGTIVITDKFEVRASDGLITTTLTGTGTVVACLNAAGQVVRGASATSCS